MTIGKAGVKGWDEGTKGACVGEIRRVVVPPSFGYGEKGIDGVIPPNSTLILEMEFLKIEDRVLSFLDRISSGNFGRGKWVHEERISGKCCFSPSTRLLVQSYWA